MLINVNSHIIIFNGRVVFQCRARFCFLIIFLLIDFVSSGIFFAVYNKHQMVTFPPFSSIQCSCYLHSLPDTSPLAGPSILDSSYSGFYEVYPQVFPKHYTHLHYSNDHFGLQFLHIYLPKSFHKQGQCIFNYMLWHKACHIVGTQYTFVE